MPEEQTDVPPSSYVPSAAPSPKTKPSSKPLSKRKPRDEKESNPQRKKKARGPQKAARYFDVAEDFIAQESVITIDPDEDVGMSEEEGQTTQATTISIIAPHRPWSPSRPFQDSSDEENEEPRGQPGAPSTQKSVPDQPSVLSTFVPEEGSNFFPLSPHEISGTELGAATALFVPVSQSIALVGVYSLTVIKGSVSVSGVVLGPSKTSHTIFAPRSSPIPVLEAVGSDATAQDLLDMLPSRLKVLVTDHSTALVLRELRTGVEGLGRIFRTFEHVFQPSPWQSTQITPDLGLAGVYMVRAI